jgi:predicted metal-dependent hydrolase
MAALEQLQFGSQTIPYEVVFAARKTLEVSVHPDLRVVVKAPEGTPLEQVRQRVSRRANWILKQQRQFEIYLPDVPPRQYLSGETHRYLGRQYRLKVVEIPAAEAERIQLTRQFLTVYAHDKSPEHIRPQVTGWYQAQAQTVFATRLKLCYPKAARFGVPYPRFNIRKMRASWGSCSARGNLTLNIKLIQVPEEYIDYVLLHELCHLKERNHGAEFEKLLTRVMPGWREKKQRLDGFDFG